ISELEKFCDDFGQVAQTAEEWTSWLQQLYVILLRESPSIALRACSPLAQEYEQLPKDLFNAAFLSCWNELNDKQRDYLARALEKALTGCSSSPELIYTLLNLAEFLEHTDQPLPISNTLLAKQALRCRA